MDEDKEQESKDAQDPEQEEAEILKRYGVKGDMRLSALRVLERQVKTKARIRGILFGVRGLLVFLLSLVVFALDAKLSGISANGNPVLHDLLDMINLRPVGIGLCAVGVILMLTAYPVYRSRLKKERDKVLPDVIRLTGGMNK